MNISRHGFGQPLYQNTALKSTRERLQRQQKADSQIDYLEERKHGLKSMECGTPEEIARKLEMYHTYEDQIAAVKMAYNQEQMFHVLEEAKEMGEKIAEKIKELEPKTAEEKKKEIAEEASGAEENDGMLEEIFDEIDTLTEEMLDELKTEQLTEEELEKQELLKEELTEKESVQTVRPDH